MHFKILFLLLFFSLNGYSQVEWDRLEVVGNDVGKNTFTKTEIKAIFRGSKSRWKNDQQVTIVMPSSKHPGCEVMAQTIFLKDMKFVKRFWLNLVFQGRSNAPIYLDSNLEILTFVKKNEGAIGVLVDSKDSGGIRLVIE